MHGFDDSFRAQRKFRIRGKWELILVLMVVIAGVVVTTIAVLKAKEKRESFFITEEDNTLNNYSKRNNNNNNNNHNHNLQHTKSTLPNGKQVENNSNSNQINSSNNNNNNNSNQHTIDSHLSVIGDDDTRTSTINRHSNRHRHNKQARNDDEPIQHDNGDKMMESNIDDNNGEINGRQMNNDGKVERRRNNNNKHNRYQAEKEFNLAPNNMDMRGYESKRVRVKVPAIMATNNEQQQPELLEHNRNHKIESGSTIRSRENGQQSQPNNHHQNHKNQNHQNHHHQQQQQSIESSLLRYDGLPGYPPPVGYDPSVYYQPDKPNANVEYTANSAGFILSPPPQNDQSVAATEEQSGPLSTRPFGLPLNSDLKMSTNPKKISPNSKVSIVAPPPPPPPPPNPLSLPPRVNIGPRTKQDLFRMMNSDNGANYLSTNEILWLHHNRPELFSTTSKLEPLASKNIATISTSVPIGNGRRFKRSPKHDDYDDDRHHFRPLRKSRPKKFIMEQMSHDIDDDEFDGRYKSKHNGKGPKRKKATNLKKNKKNLKKKKSYSKSESKKVEKLDILGSGNFEIIRGGIIDNSKDDKLLGSTKMNAETDGTKLTKHKIDNKDESSNVDNSGNDDGSNVNDEDGFDYGNNEDGDDLSNQNEQDGNQKNKDRSNSFEPFNFDLFGNDPILGFQGYDNFGNHDGSSRPSTGNGKRGGVNM
ncbi:hypothetical protein RDWZM_010135 [Blomia tropicalis]|uniref:Uncharacterized protein n=1 Tax=Blomia tropicalis TaxID=40697 RepID=A0A9Q0RIR9_BLOTA|nr:hypothetical protein RDWZM_010135 [Blomia tropicalis]